MDIRFERERERAKWMGTEHIGVRVSARSRAAIIKIHSVN